MAKIVCWVVLAMLSGCSAMHSALRVQANYRQTAFRDAWDVGMSVSWVPKPTSNTRIAP